MRWRRIIRIAVGPLVVAASFTPMVLPEALAFPYHRRVGGTEVYAERPIPDAIVGVLSRADALVRASPIDDPAGIGHRLFLTDGGWRWRVLSVAAPGAFAFGRPLVEAVIVNRSDVATDRVMNGGAIAGVRSLSGVIAHEHTHGLIRHRYGLLADWRYPAWLREGYCDHVAGGGSLSDAQAAALHARGASVPALVYHDGRKRVEAMLRANGGSVDAVFGAAG